jgi:hypothetical protein
MVLDPAVHSSREQERRRDKTHQVLSPSSPVGISATLPTLPQIETAAVEAANNNTHTRYLSVDSRKQNMTNKPHNTSGNETKNKQN